MVYGHRIGAAAAVGLALLGAALAARPASAQSFNFEELTLGSYSSVTSTQGGLSVTVTPAGPGQFTVEDTLTAIFGNRSLLNFRRNTGSGTDLILDFSSLLSSVSIQAGDFNGDADTFTLVAFSGANATGAILGTNIVPYAATDDIRNGIAATLSVSAPGIQSIRLSTGVAFPGSGFYDNLRAVVQAPAPGGVVPEPGSVLLALSGLPTAALVLRRRRKA